MNKAKEREVRYTEHERGRKRGRKEEEREVGRYRCCETEVETRMECWLLIVVYKRTLGGEPYTHGRACALA